MCVENDEGRLPERWRKCFVIRGGIADGAHGFETRGLKLPQSMVDNSPLRGGSDEKKEEQLDNVRH